MVIALWAPWASYQIRNIASCACVGNAGNVFPRRRLQRKPLVSDPGMHHGTCVTHVPWCMSVSLASGGGDNVPGIPGACAPAIFRIWQEAHDLVPFNSLWGWYMYVSKLCHHWFRFCVVASSVPIIGTNDGLLLIGFAWTNFRHILIKVLFSGYFWRWCIKNAYQISSAKRRQICPGLNVFITYDITSLDAVWVVFKIVQLLWNFHL